MSSSAGHLVVRARPAEQNLLSISVVHGAYRLVDYGAAFAPGQGCQAHTRHVVACKRTAGGSVAVLLGDGNDSAVLGDLPDPVVVNGGEGDDLAVGGDGGDLLSGGPGHDTLRGSGGPDVLAGGEDEDFLVGDAGDDLLSGADGSDELAGGDGDDELSGGLGDDRISGSNGADELIGGSGYDVLDGGNGDDRVYGGTGADVLNGGDGSDELYGGLQADSLTGGPGLDLIYGGPHFDLIYAIDGFLDLIDCGGDPGTVHADAFEQLTACPPKAPVAALGGAVTYGAIGLPTPILPVTIQFVRRHLLRVLVKAASSADVLVRVEFRDRHGRTFLRAVVHIRTNQWHALSHMLPRRTRTVEATCCR